MIKHAGCAYSVGSGIYYGFMPRRYEEREGGDKWGGVVVDLISKTTKESYGDDGPLHLDGQRMGPNC